MIKATVSKANLITITMKNIVDKLKKKNLFHLNILQLDD